RRAVPARVFLGRQRAEAGVRGRLPCRKPRTGASHEVLGALGHGERRGDADAADGLGATLKVFPVEPGARGTAARVLRTLLGVTAVACALLAPMPGRADAQPEAATHPSA